MKALGRVKDDADAWRSAIDQASSQRPSTEFPVSRAGDEMTRGKREQRSSEIRGPGKQDLEHGLGRTQCDSDRSYLLEWEFHGRSPFSLPSRSCTLCGAIDHSCSRNTLFSLQLGTCSLTTPPNDVNDALFHCCSGAQIVPSFYESGKTCEPRVCFLSRAGLYTTDIRLAAPSPEGQ